MLAEMSFSWKDCISGLALMLSVAIWIRTIRRDKNEPKRLELRKLLDDLETHVEEATAEIERHLLYLEARLDRVEIHRRTNKVENLIFKLNERLPPDQVSELRRPYIAWSRILTNDPFPISKKKDRLKQGAPEIQQRKDKAETLLQVIDSLRRKV